jgi:hypothetical protein
MDPDKLWKPVQALKIWRRRRFRSIFNQRKEPGVDKEEPAPKDSRQEYEQEE